MLPTVSIYPGTSGWSYPAGYGKWNGVFYPKGRKVDELAYYAERFPAVEVNVTFYRLPSLETVRGWVERTPSSFLFSVKLFRKFTHPEFYAREEGLSPEITPEDVAGMRGVLDVLAARERLGAVLVEAPEQLMSRRLLGECRSFVRLPGGGVGARYGAHDDRVMAMAMGLAVRAGL